MTHLYQILLFFNINNKQWSQLSVPRINEYKDSLTQKKEYKDSLFDPKKRHKDSLFTFHIFFD